ncbi:MAG: 30S ribosomal protein S2 [Lentisphaeria bacterium]|nr:30S ribosomal protein S2 [Lentisphaeria bacterium]
MPITVKDLLEAGCHFGHQTRRWNPKMKDFVYGAKNGISIIDLTKTIRQIGEACNFLQREVMDGARILFVGTKRQAQQIVKETAEATGMFYMSERWMGGTLTNIETIKKSIRKMRDIDETIGGDNAAGLKKNEIAIMQRAAVKLHRDLDGIADMKKLPDVVVVIDVCHDSIAVSEARKLNIPVVAIVDTNANPELIDYPIAANDDAVKSIKIIVDTLVEAIKDASELYKAKAAEEKAKEDDEKAKAKAEGAEEAAPKKAPRSAASRRAPAKRIAKNADGEAVEKTAGNPEPAEKEPVKKAAPRRKPAAKKEVKSLSEIKKSDVAPTAE